MISMFLSMLLSLSLVLSPLATNDQIESLREYGVSQGCADLVVSRYTTVDKPNGYFTVLKDGHPLIKLFLPYKDFPDKFIKPIFYHELGHCMQAYQYPEIFQQGPVAELDADMWSAEFMCRQGMDGRALYWEFLDFLRGKYNYHGDAGHGSLQARHDAVLNAPSCR